MAFSKISIAFLILLGFLASSSSARKTKNHHSRRKPCKHLVLYFHEILYNGHNATSTIVTAPEGANLTGLADQFYFGNIVVFDDPITLDNKDLHSEPVGRAQGMYSYDSKSTFASWLGFSFALNGTDHKGTINFVGANPVLNESRDVSVVGGTGDFFMHQGIATLTTDAVEWRVFFRLRVDIKFYRCW